MEYRRAVVIDAGSTNAANKRTLRSDCGCVGKNSLTEPTLLEMSGYPTNQDLDLSARVTPVLQVAVTVASSFPP